MLNNAYQFVMIFDVENGNPNGDPDAGNMPRMDTETNYGFVTDVCLKRKIRNYVELVKGDEEGYDIIIKMDKALNTKLKEAKELKGFQANKEMSAVEKLEVQQYLCQKYFDVRTFGAVLSIAKEEKAQAGVVRGPVQLTFAKSLSPINPIDVSITRQAVTKVEEFGKPAEMGRKSIIPYAAYRAEGFISASLANKYGFSQDDLELLWTSIINMFEEDRSAARGKMCMRKLYVFKHDNILGNCPSHILFDKIQIEELATPVKSFKDYKITIDEQMPAGVEFISKI